MSCAFPTRGRFSGFGDLRWFIACAYRIAPARASLEIAGGPTWVANQLFEIQAVSSAEAASAFTLSQGLLMLQGLLADRFKLRVHRETKDVPTYALIVARRDGVPGPRLHPTPEECSAWIAGGRRGAPPPVAGDLPCGRQVVSAFSFRSTAMPMSQLVNLLSPRVDRPVRDQTGLTGTFALDLQWRPEEAPPGSSFAESLPTSLFTAVQEQLGLKLEPAKGTLDLLVIDHVERPPPD